jgi:hypothetical protein
MAIPCNKDFSVQFGKSPDMGLEGMKAFPFIYTFINHNDNPWKPYLADCNLLSFQALSNITRTIPATGTKTINVILDPDYNFKLLGIRYSAYKYVPPSPPNGTPGVSKFPWYTHSLTVVSDGIDTDMNKIGTPLIRYIRATVSFQGSGSTVLYGGQNIYSVPNAMTVNGKTPLPMEASQGHDYGHFRVRTPYLLPMQGTIVFEVTNDFEEDLAVAAAIYGMKIRI